MSHILKALLPVALCTISVISSAQTDKKQPQADESVKHIPWYAPRPDEKRTSSEVDLSFAPTEMKMVGPSPEVARATKYSDYPMSYCLGLVDVSIPLYVVKSHSLSLPISLCYDSGGIRVDDFSGPVGLGWTLEAGGVITRSVSGDEDETSFGWANRWEEDPIDPTFDNPDYLAELADGTRDSSADIFSYNFCGHKGSFYIDWQSDSLDVVPTSATDLAIKVTAEGFTVTDTDGTRYSFTQSERSVRYTTASDPVPGIGTSSISSGYLNPITSWYLTEISSIDHTDVITLKYKTYEEFFTEYSFEPRYYQFSYYYNSSSYVWRDDNGLWETGTGYPEITYGTGGYEIKTEFCPQYLDSILFTGGYVNFEYAQNNGNNVASRKSYSRILDRFTVMSTPPATVSDTEVFRCKFSVPFQASDRRNLLTEVKLTDRDGAPIETYSFTYIDQGALMNPFSKDLFGYYNAANNSGTAFLRLFEAHNYFGETMANRNYNAGSVSRLSLQTISTASGARTEFSYEGNSITTNYPGAMFSTIGIGHRISSIRTYDLSEGPQTLVRRRDFTYSSPGITIPEAMFVLGSFVSLTEIFREDLLEWSPNWTGSGAMPRTATVVFNDQSIISGVPLESARIYYGNVTERISGPEYGTSSVRTDYVFSTSGATYDMGGTSWTLGATHNSHDNSHNTYGLHHYHFFQRPPHSVPKTSYEQSVDFTPNQSILFPSDFPQLTSPTVIRCYKSVGSTYTLVSETINEYQRNSDLVRIGYQVKNMIAFGDEDCLDDEWDMADFSRAGIDHRIIWYRLTKTTETEWLDDGSTQSSVTTYDYIPQSNNMNFIPENGAVLSPKTRTTTFGGDASRTYSWNYVYPEELVSTASWAAQVAANGYRQPVQESITAGTGSGSATTTRNVTWALFTTPDTGTSILRPSTVSISRRNPGESTASNAGPTIHYEAYDRHGNVIQIRKDNEPSTTYVWGYGGLVPVLEVNGLTYSEVRSAVGSSTLTSISNGRPTSQQLSSARTNLEASSSPLRLVSWYLYDMPFGMSQTSDVSGRLTYYEYDGAGRLTAVKDESGYKVNSYEYALNNGGTGNPNRVSSYTYTTGAASGSSYLDVVFFDGLGRTVQTIASRAATSSRDLVTPVVPDFLDRDDSKVYLPYPASTSGNAGNYRSGALSSQQSHYGSGVRAYTENMYEVSGRNRVIASSLPGFTETTDLETKGSPASTVLKLSYNASTNKISASGYYAQNRFTVTVSEGPDGSKTEVYTDEFGTPVLERVKLDASGTMADTYYIKDVLGRVVCVLPPAEASKLSSSTSNFSADNCYTYGYDRRDRVTSRRTPGNVQETIVYNDMDLPTSRTRRSAASISDEVFSTEYDNFGRPTKETYKYGTNTAFTMAEYSYDSYPSWAPDFFAENGVVTSSEMDTRTRGLKTAERIAMLPANLAPSSLNASASVARESRAFYYDAKGRSRQTARVNTEGVTDYISSQYGFAGNLIKERQRVKPGTNQAEHTLDRTYGYDSRLRMVAVTASLDGGSGVTQSISYDDLQRISSVNRGSGVETTSYTYTLQGWLSSAVSTSWEETLRYASPSRSATDALPGKAGLVTEWTQQQKGTSSNGATASETYAYSYDKSGRLTGSLRYAGGSTSAVNTLTERNISYDRSGNLLTLNRYGESSGTTPIESLSYTYNGSRRSTWTYDNHANVTSDPQSGVSVAWNAIDQPRSIAAGTASTQRSYLADGTLVSVGDGTVTRLYLGDMVFNKASNGTVTLESVGWEGGRLLPGSGNDKILFVVADHLGSVRVVKDGSGAVRQRFDYYPYGTVSRAWTASSTTDVSEKRYRFGGKEIAGSSLTDLAGTGAASGAPYLDFGARLYSPRTASWLSPDPFSEKYYGISPYAYCNGDPVNFVDPDGRIVANPTIPIWLINSHMAIEMLSASAAALFSFAGPAIAFIGTAFLCTSDTPLAQSSSVQNSKPYYPPSPGWLGDKGRKAKADQDKIGADFQTAVENSGMGNNNNDFKPRNNGNHKLDPLTAILFVLAQVGECTNAGSGPSVATSNGEKQNQQSKQNANDTQISPTQPDNNDGNSDRPSNIWQFIIEVFNAHN